MIVVPLITAASEALPQICILSASSETSTGLIDSETKNEAEKLQKRLKEIGSLSEQKKKEILALWQNMQTDFPVYANILPDGLPQTEDFCLVVLGFRLNPDGSMQNELTERLKVALVSAKKYPQARIVCTGGGTAENEPTATEADKMADWLIEHGIAADRIIVENRSLSTVQNAIFTFDVLAQQAPAIRKLAIISSDYHVPMGTLLFAAEAILRADENEAERVTVISNAAWPTASERKTLPVHTGMLIQLVEKTVELIHETEEFPRQPEQPE